MVQDSKKGRSLCAQMQEMMELDTQGPLGISSPGKEMASVKVLMMVFLEY